MALRRCFHLTGVRVGGWEIGERRGEKEGSRRGFEFDGSDQSTGAHVHLKKPIKE